MLKRINKGIKGFLGGIVGLIMVIIFLAWPPLGLLIFILFGLYVFKLSRQKEDSTND